METVQTDIDQWPNRLWNCEKAKGDHFETQTEILYIAQLIYLLFNKLYLKI